jgi:hypothetical protein
MKLPGSHRTGRISTAPEGILGISCEILRPRGLADGRKTCYRTCRRPRLYVVGRLFCCRADLIGPAPSNSIRETAMAYARPSWVAEPQPKSDPADASDNPMGLIRHRGDLHWWAGTEADPAASFPARPAVIRAMPGKRPGWHPIPIPLLDNRTVVTRHQVGQRPARPARPVRRARPTTASSHTARCAAEGRRSGTRAPDSRRARPDS